MHDLLHGPLIGVRTEQGERRVNLPELLALLSAEAIEGYTGLRAHQADPWHVFLVQLAASIQARHPTERLPTDPVYWREGLLDLAEGIPEAWQLVVEDVTKPAFFQHPVDHTAKYEICARTPDELDVLFNSRKHDVKPARINHGDLEAWVYSLMTRQTLSPYAGGQGRLNGIARMNSGTGSRPIIAWVRNMHPSRRFIDEVRELGFLRREVLKSRFGFKDRGVVLTWTKPWNHSGHQFFLEDLEPWFIESARLIRLKLSNKIIVAKQAGTNARQIGPKETHTGDVGDPWIPITTDDTALTIQNPGFTPKTLCRLIFMEKIQTTPGLLQPREADTFGYFVGSVLMSGGNCKTNGFSRVALPIPDKVRPLLFRAASRKNLGALAQKFLNDANAVESALSTAMEVLLVEFARKLIGPDKRLEHDLSNLIQAKKNKDTKPFFERTQRTVSKVKWTFIKKWEQNFFPTLWRAAEEEHDAVRLDWQQHLVDAAQELLEEAVERLPLPANCTWRARTKAQRAFQGLLRRKNLPQPNTTSLSDVSEEIRQ